MVKRTAERMKKCNAAQTLNSPKAEQFATGRKRELHPVNYTRCRKVASEPLVLFVVSKMTLDVRVSVMRYNMAAGGKELWMYGQCFRPFSKTTTHLETPRSQ